MALHQIVRLSCRFARQSLVRGRYSITPNISMSLVMAADKYYSSHTITQNLILNTLSPVSIVQDGSVPRVVVKGQQQPLLLLLEYMNAKDKHVKKFVDFYISYGFDVLRIHLKPWQLLWPVKGSQVVAKDIAEFLSKNNSYSPLVVHAFSVGGYLWGEVLVHLENHKDKYHAVADRFHGQIYDSAVDIDEIPVGFPNAVFPNNPLLKNTFEKYIRYHMKTFYNESTRHYEKSRSTFTAGVIRAPVLLMFSDKDPLSTPKTNEIARKEWEQANVECKIKCFKDSKHVMHFQKHREAYLAELDDFLIKTNVIQLMALKAKL